MKKKPHRKPKRTATRATARPRRTVRYTRNPDLGRLTKEQAEAKLREAVHLYEKFHGEEARFVTSIKPRRHDKILLQIGKLVGVMYQAKRDGVTKKFLHQFTGASQPILASSSDGKQLYVIGGNYDFTEDGIVDR